MTYRLGANGKEYVVIAAGGHPKIAEESLSDAIIAFTYPDRRQRMDLSGIG